jgi:hypothetical protein
LFITDMFATLARPYNYVGRSKGDSETMCLSAEEQESYISTVLKDSAHKKDLLDYTNPSKKLRTAMDTVTQSSKKNREAVIKELLMMHKFDFVVRTKLPPKHNSAARQRDENVIRDSRRTLNWLYEVADEEGINVSHINDPCSHFNHAVSMFLNGDCVFDLRNTSLVKAAYQDCFDNCVYAIKDRRNRDLLELERTILDSDEELNEFITPQAPKKVKVPLQPFQLSPLATLDESMMVHQDKHHYDPRFNKTTNQPKKLFGSPNKKRSPPFPQPTPSKWMSSDDKNNMSLLLEAADMVSPKKKSVPKKADTPVLKVDSVLVLGGKSFKVTFETRFEEIQKCDAVAGESVDSSAVETFSSGAATEMNPPGFAMNSSTAAETNPPVTDPSLRAVFSAAETNPVLRDAILAAERNPRLRRHAEKRRIMDAALAREAALDALLAKDAHQV